MTVSFEERQGSPKERWTIDSYQATRTGIIAWSDRHAFIQEWKGVQYPGTAAYAAPCKSIQFDPFGKMVPSGDASKARYVDALVTMQFGTLTSSEVLATDPITERIVPTAQHIPLPAGKFQWGAGSGTVLAPLDDKEAPTKLLKGFDYIKTYQTTASIPGNILTFIDTINKEKLVPESPGFSNLTFQPTTLLFNAPTITRAVDRVGATVVSISYRFSYRPNWDLSNPADPVAHGWNAWWNASTGLFERIYKTGETDTENYYRNFKEKSFMDVFG